VKDTVAINDRWGRGLGTGQEWVHGGYHSGPDRFNPGKVQPHKWESPMTIDKKSWGYRKDAVAADYLTVHELIVKLVEAVRYCFRNLIFY
jgi:alpha-L-fucosidase